MTSQSPILDEVEQAKRIFQMRTLVKTVSQISYEMKEIDKSLPLDYYELEHGAKLLELYNIIADKIIEVAIKIQEVRQEKV